MIIRLKTANFSANNIGELTKWYIKNQTSGMNLTLNASSINKTDTTTAITGTLSVKSGYTLTEAVKIMMGTLNKTSWYDSTTGAITIPAGSITDNVYITGKAVSESGEEEPDEPTTGETDITSLISATFSQGAVFTSDSTVNGDNAGGSQTNQTVYVGNTSNSSYVNISAYAGKTLKITVPNALQAQHTKYGLTFYTGSSKGTRIADAGYTMEYDASNLNVATAKVVEIAIPSTAVNLRTTWHTADNETVCGVTFSAKIVG